MKFDSETTYNDGTKESTDETYSQSGTVGLLGLYMDWGEDGFGARVGANYLSTQYNDLDINGSKYEIDASGVDLYINLRVAF